MPIEQLKTLVTGAVDAQSHQLREIALKIHANPELGFQEVKAAGWLSQYLEENGFSLERGVGEIPTAFKARYGRGAPAIAILAEYDALPEIGHACGHNLIATSSIGAGVAAKAAIDQFGGSILIMGTPAEELFGGKIIMAERGVFNDVDVAMIVHPGTDNTATTKALACQTLEVEFHGKAAHAAARPEAGINALEAMLLSFASINALRQHIRSTARIHGIITDGGKAANIVPVHSAGLFMVRAKENAYLDELKQKVLNCFTGAATATGTRLEYKWDKVSYAPMRNNRPLAQLFARNMRSLGRRVTLSETGGGFGSTDMGNVSQLAPAIHPQVAIARRGVSIHSPGFAVAAASEDGIKGMLDAAKSLAMTVVDLVASTETMDQIKKEFHRQK